MSTPKMPSAARVTSLDDIQNKHFDYIIVGGGTCGCLVAARLAGESNPKCSVLLVEAGGEDDPENLVPGLTKPKFGNEKGNWGYVTTPQEALGGRTIPYPRGKGMGGCSANNFMAWIRGPKSDWDDWSEAVKDPYWRWENVLRVMMKLEDFRSSIPAGEERYAEPAEGLHSKGGPIAVGYGSTWQKLVRFCLLGSEQAGHTVNKDVNSGNPIGLNVAQFNTNNGVRATSATAFLHEDARSKLDNLVIVTAALCSKVLFEDKKAVGVQLIPTQASATTEDDIPTTIHCKREIILTAGSFATPQILLLSGVGPASDLSSLSIPVVADIPAVGANLRDHSAFACEFILDKSAGPSHNQLLNNPTALAAATKQYEENKTGPLAVFGASAAVIFPRITSLYESKAFYALREQTQAFLKRPDRPSTEIWMHGGPLFYTGADCPPDVPVLCLEGLCQNNLSTGNLRLQSTNPRTLPSINPNYLTHPYDREIALQTLKEILEIAHSPAISSIVTTVLHGPRDSWNKDMLASPEASLSNDNDTILESFLTDTLTQGFHAMSTCIMGPEGEENRVVDTEFRVVGGLKGLRVADMSVCPILTSNHTQVNAYLIAERCADLVLADMRGRK